MPGDHIYLSCQPRLSCFFGHRNQQHYSYPSLRQHLFKPHLLMLCADKAVTLLCLDSGCWVVHISRQETETPGTQEKLG